jgi:hypothetical protein
MLISEFQVYFSYNQFMVFDKEVKSPGNDWTDDHVRQGFARRDSSVNFGTLLEFGDAKVQVFKAPYAPDENDERVIAVPFFCSSGEVLIEGPEEDSRDPVRIEPGHFVLTVAQQVNQEDERLFIRLYFSSVESQTVHSQIIVADEQLTLPHQLLETSEIATF